MIFNLLYLLISFSAKNAFSHMNLCTNTAIMDSGVERYNFKGVDGVLDHDYVCKEMWPRIVLSGKICGDIIKFNQSLILETSMSVIWAPNAGRKFRTVRLNHEKKSRESKGKIEDEFSNIIDTKVEKMHLTFDVLSINKNKVSKTNKNNLMKKKKFAEKENDSVTVNIEDEYVDSSGYFNIDYFEKIPDYTSSVEENFDSRKYLLAFSVSGCEYKSSDKPPQLLLWWSKVNINEIDYFTDSSHLIEIIRSDLNTEVNLLEICWNNVFSLYIFLFEISPSTNLVDTIHIKDTVDFFRLISHYGLCNDVLALNHYRIIVHREEVMISDFDEESRNTKKLLSISEEEEGNAGGASFNKFEVGFKILCRILVTPLMVLIMSKFTVF